MPIASVPARVSPIALILAILIAAPVFSQSNDPSGLDEARALIRSGEHGEAARVLEAITQADPENVRAWALLGFALHSAGELDRAIEAHMRAAEFEATRPTAMYNAGLAYALKGEPGKAFEWLFGAKATGRLDITRIAFDPDSKSLRDDPRWRKLFPKEEEFGDPFVEPARIIREWRGESARDQFGWIARNIGDVDGDGSNDVATSAPTSSKAGEEAGRIYVYSARTGQRLWAVSGPEGGRLGLGIEAAGDVNADGIPDVIAGAPGADRSHVYSGGDGSLLLELEAAQPGAAFGRRVSDVGDVDGDGHDDVLVGAPGYDAGGEDTGRAYLYSGADGSRLFSWTGEEAGDRLGAAGAGLVEDGRTFIVLGAPDAGAGDRGRTYVYTALDREPAFVIESEAQGAELGGMFVSVVGDVDADGVPDIYASDWSHRAKGRTTGRVYVHSGADGRRLLTLTGEAAADGFGIGPADAGDVNADGHDDLVIGAWQHGSAAPGGGAVYLFSGKDGALLRKWTGRVMGETLGFDATGMGDVDGDGAIDLLATSAWSAINGPRSGRMYILSGELP